MKAAAVFLINTLMLFAGSCEGIRILTVMPMHAKSHHIWFSSLSSALAARGHQVHSIDIGLPKVHPPTLDVRVLSPPTILEYDKMAPMIRMFQTGSVVEKIRFFTETSVSSCKELMKDTPMQELLSPDFKKEFDVLLLSYAWHECLFGLIHRFNYTPAIVASPFPLPMPILRHLGNPLFHATPHYFSNYATPMNFWQRIASLAVYLYDEYMYFSYEEPDMEEVMRKYFGDDVPPVKELAKHIALGFVNMVDIKPRLPLVANIIPVGGMHIPPVQPLKENLKKFLDDAKDGAIIMSFGTIIRGDKIGPDKLAAVLKVFSRLPQRLVWKFESAADFINLSNITSNVLLQSWLPQNDVLAHPNIRLFISHCGGLSSQEAAYHGVPILGIPFIVDQYANVDQVVASGAGLKLPITELTEETFYGNITELLSNPQYYATAQRMKAVMQDQLVTPLERAVFYVEYVARHRGAHHLRSPLVDLPLSPHTLLIDVAIAVTTVITTLAVTIGIIACILRKICTCSRRTQSSKTSSSKKKD